MYGLESIERFVSVNGIINLQLPSIRANCCLPEGVQFEPPFQCLVRFVVSKVGRFFHSVQFLSVWKLDHVVAVHRDITTVVPIQMEAKLF